MQEVAAKDESRAERDASLVFLSFLAGFQLASRGLCRCTPPEPNSFDSLKNANNRHQSAACTRRKGRKPDVLALLHLNQNSLLLPSTMLRTTLRSSRSIPSLRVAANPVSQRSLASTALFQTAWEKSTVPVLKAALKARGLSTSVLSSASPFVPTGELINLLSLWCAVLVARTFS